MTSLKYTHLFHSLILNPLDIIILSNFSYYYFATCFNPYKDIYIYIYMSTPSLENEELSLGLHSTTHYGDTPEHARGPLETPSLSEMVLCGVCMCSVGRGLRGTLGALSLSLSMEEGRSTFGVMARI